MIRYLKYVFLTFGLLALGLMTFFYQQNKKDIALALEYRGKLDRAEVQKNCASDQQGSLYSCFKNKVTPFFEQAGLTGLSLGLRFAFNFLEEDKAKTQVYADNQAAKDVFYALHYLEMNNLVLKNVTHQFHGFQFTYGGYLSRMKDLLDKAKKFSDNLILGIESDDGLAKLRDHHDYEALKKRFLDLKKNYNQYYRQAKSWNDNRIQELLAKEEA